MAIYEVNDEQLNDAWNKLLTGGRTRAPNNEPARNRGRDLSSKERGDLINQAMLVLGEIYVHRELKRRRHAVDPFNALRLFKERASQLDEESFHGELMTIFKSLNDIHTSYSPQGVRSKIAALPFLIGQCFDLPAAPPQYIVTHLLGGQFDTFEPGVEIKKWNGVPIQRALDRLAEKEDGPNTAARQALGVMFLTVRWLGASLPPDEEWVVVQYLPLGSEKKEEEKEIRFQWQLIDLKNELEVASQAIWEVRDHPNFNPRMQVEHTARQAAFATPSVHPKCPVAPPHGWQSEDVKLDELPHNTLEEANVTQALSVRTIRRDGGHWVAHIRIRHFLIVSIKEYVEGLGKLLKRLKESKKIKGVILDLRDNAGGYLEAAESLLQLFSDDPITQIDYAILASPLTLEMTTMPNLDKNNLEAFKGRATFEPWHRSVEDALNSSGSIYSRSVPLTQTDLVNEIGREFRYHGKVVLLTSPLTYSAGEVFSAGFEDHALGKIIGTGETTGGGGATYRDHEQLVIMALPGLKTLVVKPDDQKHARSEKDSKKEEEERKKASPLVRYAVARATRVNDNTGVPIEDIGVPSANRHWLRRQDVVGDNEVMLGLAMDVLLKEPPEDQTVVTGIRGLEEVEGIEEEAPHPIDADKKELPKPAFANNMERLVKNKVIEETVTAFQREVLEDLSKEEVDFLVRIKQQMGGLKPWNFKEFNQAKLY